MKLSEIESTLAEHGRTYGFPGYSMGLFGQRHYEFMVTRIVREQEPLRTHLANWFETAFDKDNPKFKSHVFKNAVTQGKSYGAFPTFQQRHFWYLATLIKQAEDAEEREFMAHWLADHVGGTNPQFKRDLWMKACGVADE